MKKVLAMILALVMALSLVACSNGGTDKPDDNTETKKIKVGFITLHDENSTYDLNFINAAKEACQTLGLVENEDYFIKKNVPEGQECYNAAAELAEQGCNIIFADSFGHEDYMIQAAKDFPDVQFCHSTGTKAHTEGLSNYHNAFASIYEGRYLAGIAAGMKLNEMIEAGKFTADEAKMGYVGAFTYAEVISGYTSFYLGAKSVCPTVTMDVTFTGSWYDEALEKEAANKLIAGGCKLISQHADSMGAPTACETAGVPNVSYNGSTESACPNTFIVSSRIDWTPYYEMVIKAVQDGTSLDSDWTGTLKTGSVVLTDVNEKVAAKGTAEKIAEVTKQLEDGTLHVFDTSTFTVKGETLTSYMADVDTDADRVFNRVQQIVVGLSGFDVSPALRHAAIGHDIVICVVLAAAARTSRTSGYGLRISRRTLVQTIYPRLNLLPARNFAGIGGITAFQTVGKVIFLAQQLKVDVARIIRRIAEIPGIVFGRAVLQEHFAHNRLCLRLNVNFAHVGTRRQIKRIQNRYECRQQYPDIHLRHAPFQIL